MGATVASIHPAAEKAHSRKLALAKSVPTSSFELPGPAGHARNTPGRREKVSYVTRSCCNLWRLATPQSPENLRVRRSYALEYSTEDTEFHCTTKNFFHRNASPPLPVATGPIPIHQRRTYNRLALSSALPVKVYYVYPVPRHENYPTYMRALVNNFVSNPEFVYVS